MVGLVVFKVVEKLIGLFELLGRGLVVVADVHFQRLYQITYDQIDSLFDNLMLLTHGQLHLL